MPSRGAPSNWAELSDERLLDLRLADLPLRLEGTVMEARIAQLRAELDLCELRIPLHCYIADEWFTPDGTAAIAVPFYLTHPRLERLERAQMLEVEGGEHEWCMRILRHEAGHVVDNVYKLRLKRRRQALFGRSSTSYPELYEPSPYSRSFVMHLDAWYAQSHPDEDFAETFAVWLNPDADWKRRYEGWPALEKLAYMAELMRRLRGAPPLVDNVEEVDPLRHNRRTLRQHYRRKRQYYGVDNARVHDRQLRRLFSSASEHAGNMTAARFLAKVRRPTVRTVASWTGIHRYTIDRVLEDMMARCRTLGLHLAVPEDKARAEFTLLLIVQTMNLVHSGRHRSAL